jgi:hypothetical protein
VNIHSSIDVIYSSCWNGTKKTDKSIKFNTVSENNRQKLYTNKNTVHSWNPSISSLFHTACDCFTNREMVIDFCKIHREKKMQRNREKEAFKAGWIIEAKFFRLSFFSWQKDKGKHNEIHLRPFILFCLPLVEERASIYLNASLWYFHF